MSEKKVDSKELAKILGISDDTLSRWRRSIMKISGVKFEMGATPRGYAMYLYNEIDIKKFKEFAKEVKKTGEYDNSARKVFGDRYERMIKEKVDELYEDMEFWSDKFFEHGEALDTLNDILTKLTSENRDLKERLGVLEKAFEEEQGKGALEKLGFRRS